MKSHQSITDAIFTKAQHSRILSQVEKEYFNFIDDIREDLKKGFTTDVVDPHFLDQLNDIVHDEAFDQYSPLKFYWMGLIDNIVYLIQLHEEILNSEEYNESSDVLTEVEEELNAFWSDSEFGKIYFEALNDGLPVIEASDQLLPLIENQIITFYVLHINLFQQEFDDAVVYQAIREVGDFEKRIYIGDQNKYFDFATIPDGFPSLAIKAILPHKNEIVLEIKDTDHTFKIKETNRFISLGEHKIFLRAGCEKAVKLEPKLLENLEMATKAIKIAAPHVLETLKSFTKIIVAIDESDIHSHSIQSLPGYTLINMFDADSINLISAIVLENGHHYLNALLNYQDLLNEAVVKNEKDLISPWTKAPCTPLEIYRSSFIHFWQHEIFAALQHAINGKKLSFTDEEKLKLDKALKDNAQKLNDNLENIKYLCNEKIINKWAIDMINQLYKRIKTLNLT